MRAERLEFESSSGEQGTCMRIRTLFLPLQVAALFSIAAMPGQAQAADDVERSVHLRYGQPNGFQVVRHNADGSLSVHFEYNDRGDPTIDISDIRKVRTVLRGDRLYDSAALFQSMGVAPAP